MSFSTFVTILRARFKLMLLVLLVTMGTTLVISLMLPPTYKATTTLIVNAKEKDPLSGVILPQQLMPDYIATQVDIISSHAVARKVVEALKLSDSPDVKNDFMTTTDGKGDITDWLADLLLKNQTVQPSRESRAIDISFKGSNPIFAAAVANAFAQSYIQTNLDLRAEPAHQLSIWYDQQLKHLRDNVAKAQSVLTEYQDKNGIVASDERLDVANARLADLSSQYVSAQSLAADSQARQNQSSGSADVMNSVVVQQLRAQLAQNEANLAQLGQNLGQNHPQYQSAKAQVVELKAKLAAEIQSETHVVAATARAAQQRAANIRSSLLGQKTEMLKDKKQREELSSLVSNVQNAQQIYDQAVQRYTQTTMEAQNTQTEIAILNQAIPPLKQDGPKVFLNMVLSTFLGGLLAVGVAFIAELRNRKLRGPQDISELLGVPVLGLIESLPVKKRLFGSFLMPKLKGAA